MKIQDGVENVARRTAEKLGEGWSAQSTILGARLTGPGDACILMELDGDLVHVYGEAIPFGSGVPEGYFPIDDAMIGYFVCNALYRKYMMYLADAREARADLSRWHERMTTSIARFAKAAGSPAAEVYGKDGDLQTQFLAHGCRVDVESHHHGEDTIRITVPSRLDLGNMAITWNYDSEKTAA